MRLCTYMLTSFSCTRPLRALSSAIHYCSHGQMSCPTQFTKCQSTVALQVSKCSVAFPTKLRFRLSLPDQEIQVESLQQGRSGSVDNPGVLWRLSLKVPKFCPIPTVYAGVANHVIHDMWQNDCNWSDLWCMTIWCCCDDNKFLFRV